MKLTWMALFYLVPAWGQTAPAFDAVSLKPSKHISWHDDVDTAMMIEHGATLKNLIALAFDVKDFQVSGGPKWIDSDRWDVDAKAAGPAKDDELSRMLEAMLKDRFQLAVHHDSKPVAGFALVVVKGGIRAKRAEDTAEPSSKSHGGKLQAHAQSMADLASYLARRTATPIVDATGLSDLFDFTLEWDTRQDKFLQSVPVNMPSEPPADRNAQPIWIAIQDQLGLRLEGRKVPLDVIVVDKAEKPTMN